jgi:hypothetical protein
MDDPAHTLTWEIDDGGLSRAEARALRKAVDTCAHWLEVWNSLVRAGVARPVTLVAAMHDGDDVVLTADRDDARLRVAVPKALPGDVGLPYQVLAGVLEAVETAARLFPHSPPPDIWERPFAEETDEDPGPSGVEWELLEPEEMLLFSSLADADRDGLPTPLRLDEYVFDQVAGTGVAEVVETAGGGSPGAVWTIELR